MTAQQFGDKAIALLDRTDHDPAGIADQLGRLFVYACPTDRDTVLAFLDALPKDDRTEFLAQCEDL